ncbi:MAG TPA: YciI family protein [Terriglobia bacterium]|nr:YciI family protein [Terriglobia bacterium]
MKFVCLGYIEPGKFESFTENERNAMLDECFTYDAILQQNGHFAGGEGLQGPNTAVTLRWNKNKVSVTDGPYAETKEQLGGILILEARDLDHAIEIMSKHSGVKAGPFEIRPAADLSGFVRESEERRNQKKGA